MSKPTEAACQYRITLEGYLDACWADWFAGFTMTSQGHNGELTVLTGAVADQAALRGLLNQIWDFNLALVAVERFDSPVIGEP